MNNYELVASGEKWVGEGIKSSFNVVSDLIDESYNNLTLTIYIIQDYQIWEKLKSAVNRKIKIKIYMYNNPDKKFKGFFDEVLEYSGDHSNLKVYETDKEKIHSKVIIADKSKVYMGSANLTNSGLKHNYELGIYVDDEEFAFNLENIIKKLVE